MSTAAPPDEVATDTILSVSNLEVVYNGVALVLRGVSLAVPRGQIIAVLGSNGAGKTTLLRAITGLLDVHRGEITKGRVELEGERIDNRDPAATVRSGVSQVMEGRRIFASLTVDENLRAGAYTRRSKSEVAESYQRVMDLFPKLVERRGQIINLSSVAATYPYKGGAVYAGTKAFVRQFSLDLRCDLAGTGVRVTSVEPGMAETEFTVVRTGGDQVASDALYANMNPMTAEDLADLFWWLANLPPHLNINAIELMPVSQSWAGFTVNREG